MDRGYQISEQEARKSRKAACKAAKKSKKSKKRESRKSRESSSSSSSGSPSSSNSVLRQVAAGRGAEPELRRTASCTQGKPGLVRSEVLQEMENRCGLGGKRPEWRATDRLDAAQSSYFRVLKHDHVQNFPVQWRPRHLNRMPDALANEVMDCGTSFLRRYRSLSDAQLQSCNLFGFADGGLRNSSDISVSSYGWCVVAWHSGSNTCFVLEEGGVSLSECTSAFAAELWGVDALVDSLDRWRRGGLDGMGMLDVKCEPCTISPVSDLARRTYVKRPITEPCHPSKKHRSQGPRGKRGIKRARPRASSDMSC